MNDMDVQIWITIAIVSFAVGGMIYELCRSLLHNDDNDVIEVDFAFTYASNAKDAYNRLNNFFYNNRDKFILKKLKLADFWGDYVLVKYKCINGYSQKVNFQEVIGDILHND